MNPSDLILVCGGEALEKWGTFVRRLAPAYRDGESLIETWTRATVGACVSRTAGLHFPASGIPQVEFVDLDGDGVRESAVTLHSPARTNLLLHNQAFDNAAWTKTRATVTANADDAPFDRSGSSITVADRLVEDTSASTTHLVSQAVTITANATLCLSVYVKENSRRWIRLVVHDGTETNSFTRFFDSRTGAPGTSSAAGTGTFIASGSEALKDGWYRVWIIGTVGNADTSVTVECRLATGDNGENYTGDGASNIRLYGAQLEEGREPSSLIVTGAATATRNADQCTIPWLRTPEAMTVYAKFVERAVPNWVVVGENSPTVCWIGDANTPRLLLFKPTTTDGYRFQHRPVGATADSDIDLNPTYGDVVELNGQLAASGATTLSGRKNSGTITTGATGTAQPLATTWSTTTLHVGMANGADGQGSIALRSLKIARGIYTLDEMASA
ncbi:MAG TPA: hypothetical protein VNL98_04780 [Gemmatimonadales bacterium]|nr:hypothetical protein [Gemmatimonadales bacterium]